MATVVSPAPLSIKLDNEGLLLTAADGDLLICEHLRDHTRRYSTSSEVVGSTSVSSNHTHTVLTIDATRQQVTVHYDLTAGDRLAVMALPGGQQYLIWDKVVVL